MREGRGGGGVLNFAWLLSALFQSPWEKNDALVVRSGGEQTMTNCLCNDCNVSSHDPPTKGFCNCDNRICAPTSTLTTNKSKMIPRREQACEWMCAGEHGNAELINKYGFALPDNPFDSIKLDKDTLLAQAADAMGEEACSQRTAFLHHHRWPSTVVSCFSCPFPSWFPLSFLAWFGFPFASPSRSAVQVIMMAISGSFLNHHL